MSGDFLCSATYDNFVDISTNLYLSVLRPTNSVPILPYLFPSKRDQFEGM